MTNFVRSFSNIFSLDPHEQVLLFEIAHKMKKIGLSELFIAAAIRIGLEYEGVADLLKLWNEETDPKEQNEIVADIQDLINDCLQSEKLEYPIVKFNDLEMVAKDIRAFKDNLLMIVNERGGIKKLADLTDIPQPSLSRFFNSNSMPRRTTLLKIAKALNLDAVKISSKWVRG